MSDLFVSVAAAFAELAQDRRRGLTPVIETGTRTVTVAQADQRVRMLIGELERVGVRPGEIVIQLTQRRPDWPLVLLTLLASRRVWLPADVTVLAMVLRRSRARWVIAEEPMGVASVLALEGVELTGVVELEGWQLLAVRHVGDEVSPALLPADAGYIIPTSGSTGTPKLVVGSRRGLEHFVRWEVDSLGLGREARVAQLTQVTFDPVLRDVFAAFASSARLCVPDNPTSLLDPSKLVAWLVEAEVTVLHCTPTLLRALTPHLHDDTPRSLRYLLLAGEELFVGDVARLEPMVRDGLQLYNLYGPTETTLAKLSHRLTLADLAKPPGTRVPVGTPIPAASAIALLPDGSPCVPREVGEIYIRTPFRSLGYLDSPDEQAARFMPNPFSDDPTDLVFRTGDLGYQLEEGGFVLVGRADRVVKIRGVRVDLGTVETAMRGIEGVRDAAVRTWRGRTNNALLAGYFVPAAGCDVQGMRGSLRRRLANHALPAVLIPLDELPKTSSGKLDYDSLPPPWDEEHPQGLDELDAIEQAVLGVFNEVLVDTPVGPDDDLLDAGGQSIEVAQLATRLTTEFGVAVRIQNLLQWGTARSTAQHLLKMVMAQMPVAAWAELVETHADGGTDLLSVAPESRAAALGSLGKRRFALVAGVLHGRAASHLPTQYGGARSDPRSAPLSFAQRRFWWMQGRAPLTPQLHYVWAQRLQGNIHLGHLERALQLLVARHDSLRTAFRVGAGEPMQSADVVGRMELDVGECLAAGATGVDAAVASLVPWASQPFAFGQDLLLRARFVRLCGDDGVLALTGHVIVSDGWTKSVLLEELALAYTALASGRTVGREPPPLAFSDFARWERAQTPAVVAKHGPYWRSHLEGVFDHPRLPFDDPACGRPAVTWGDTVTPVVSTEHSQSIRATARRWGVSTTAITGAALLGALWWWSGDSEPAFQFPIPNRPFPELERVIGCFTETALLRERICPEEPFSALARRVGNRLIEALDRAMPYEAMMRALFPDVDPHDPALMPIMFAPQPEVSRRFVLPGVSSEEVRVDLRTSVWPLQLYLYDGEEGMRLQFSYGSNCFRRETVQRLAEGYGRLLELLSRQGEFSLREARAALNRSDRCR